MTWSPPAPLRTRCAGPGHWVVLLATAVVAAIDGDAAAGFDNAEFGGPGSGLLAA